MAKYLRLLIILAAIFGSCICDYFGEADVEHANRSELYTADPEFNVLVLANAEFKRDAYLRSVEFVATGPGFIEMSFLGFPDCGRSHQPTCSDYMSQSLMDVDNRIGLYQLTTWEIKVHQAGYVKHETPLMLIPRGYVPFLRQATTNISFTTAYSQQADLCWKNEYRYPGLVEVKKSDGTRLKALFKFNVELAVFADEPVTYGLPVTTQDDQMTGSSVPLGHCFFLVNAPIQHDSYITFIQLVALKAGNITVWASVFEGCQQSDSTSCVELLTRSSDLERAAANPERARFAVQEGFNNVTLTPPIFAERKGILTICPADDQVQVALTSVNVPRSDLQSDPDRTGKHRQINISRKEAVVLSATARYFKTPPVNNFAPRHSVLEKKVLAVLVLIKMILVY